MFKAPFRLNPSLKRQSEFAITLPQQPVALLADCQCRFPFSLIDSIERTGSSDGPLGTASADSRFLRLLALHNRAASACHEMKSPCRTM